MAKGIVQTNTRTEYLTLEDLRGFVATAEENGIPDTAWVFIPAVFGGKANISRIEVYDDQVWVDPEVDSNGPAATESHEQEGNDDRG